MPRALDWLHQESMEPADLAVWVVVGIGAPPIYAVRLAAVAARLVAGRSEVAACWVAEPAPGVHPMIPLHCRLLRQQRV